MKKKKKTLQELTILDNFMFGAVMSEPENCKGLLERVLEIEIVHVEVIKEKSIIYNPEYKGIRLDIFANDEKNTRYNVEIQALSVHAIEKRARYYHGQIDMEILLSGLPYKELPNTYVIFICDFDPFGQKKYRYTQAKRCKEVPGMEMDDGAHTIYLSTKGKNEKEVPKELVQLLRYIKAPLKDSEQDFEDEFVKKLQRTVRRVKESREMGAKYMSTWQIMEDMKEMAREEGLAEGHAMARAESAKAFIELCMELGQTAEETENHLLNKFSITAEDVEDYMGRFWKKSEE